MGSERPGSNRAPRASSFSRGPLSFWTLGPCLTVAKAAWPPLPQGILLSLVPVGKRMAASHDGTLSTLVVCLPVCPP